MTDLANGLHCRKPGLKACNGQCVDTQSDASHCGTCRQSCSSGEICSDGVCGLAPPANGPQCTQASACDAFVSCGTGFAPYCACVESVEGNPASLGCYSFGAGKCNACTMDSDCTDSEGGICTANACCPSNNCVYPDYYCTNPISKRQIEATMFRPRAAGPGPFKRSVA